MRTGLDNNRSKSPVLRQPDIKKSKPSPQTASNPKGVKNQLMGKGLFSDQVKLTQINNVTTNNNQNEERRTKSPISSRNINYGNITTTTAAATSTAIAAAGPSKGHKKYPTSSNILDEMNPSKIKKEYDLMNVLNSKATAGRQVNNSTNNVKYNRNTNYNIEGLTRQGPTNYQYEFEEMDQGISHVTSNTMNSGNNNFNNNPNGASSSGNTQSYMNSSNINNANYNNNYMNNQSNGGVINSSYNNNSVVGRGITPQQSSNQHGRAAAAERVANVSREERQSQNAFYERLNKNQKVGRSISPREVEV